MKIRLALISFAMLMLTSCSEIKEVNERAFAEAIGIDREGRDYVVSLLLSEMSEDNIIRYVVSEKGMNVGNALDKIKNKLPKDLFLGHTKLIVLSQNIDEKEENSVFSDGNAGISPSVILGYAPKGAESILYSISENCNDNLNKIFLQAEKQGNILKNNIVDTHNDGGIIAVLMEEDEKGLDLDGAVKMGDFPKMILEDDCRIINLILDRLKYFGMNVRGENGVFYADAECKKSRIYVSEAGKDLKFTVKLNCEAEFSPEAYEKSASPERDFKIRLSEEIKKVMKRHSDILKLDRRVLLKFPQLSGISEAELSEIIDSSTVEVVFR